MVSPITPETLLQWLDSDKPPAVVDVRDEDHIGGHVSNSINAPSSTFTSQITKLQDQVKDYDKVVFYCQYSQQRGPSCARYFEHHLPKDSKQDVYVLSGGFSNWATTYMGKHHTDNFIEGFYV